MIKSAPHRHLGKVISAKYQLLVDEAAEFALAVGLGVELGGTGSAHLDVADFNTYEPAILFGKGLGDLGEATALLRPFAVTGFAGVSLPERGHGNLVYGGAVEYSLAYLHASVRDMDLPDWVNQLTPLIEFSLETPLSGGERTTISTPILPLAPGRESAMICWPHDSVSFTPIMRVKMSEVPPAG